MGSANEHTSDSWDDVSIICPNQCVCQQSPYMDLSIARWIQSLKGDQTLEPHSGSPNNKQKLERTNEVGEENSKPENENEVSVFIKYSCREKIFAYL